MPQNLSARLVAAHLVSGRAVAGEEIGLRIDQTLLQDATGTLVMLELEAMGLTRVRPEVCAQYVDHNLLQEDHKNADDHLFLRSACRRFGVWYSGPGNGISHVVHMARLGRPGKTLLGADSHTCAAGALGMLAIGTGGLEVALAMAGEPYHVRMPRVRGVRLTGSLPPWVSAKDLVLEVLRRHGVAGNIHTILEYYGPGVATLSAMDRHVVANMGQETGATASVFPSDEQTRTYLRTQGREGDWAPLAAEDGASFDLHEEIDLGKLEPLVALPRSPGNVVSVRDVEGTEIYQAYVGSSANPGFRDFAVAAHMVEGRRVAPGLSFDVNPSSREILENLTVQGMLLPLLAAGARLHQAGCNGCIGMGQAPATRGNSLRTVPRNFPGRSGTLDDRVYLCSPETAVASALAGRITDPRDLGLHWQAIHEPATWITDPTALEAPLPPAEAARVALAKGPNIASIPALAPIPDTLDLPVLLKAGDGLSTDEILPAGARVLPLRSNIPALAEFSFETVDRSYPHRARASGDHAVVAGANYGQGSSREHAALCPRTLGLRAVLAVGFARIHGQNLVNFGVLPLLFADPKDYARIEPGDVIGLRGLRAAVAGGRTIEASVRTGQGESRRLRLRHELSSRQCEILLAGGVIARVRAGAMV